MAELPEIEVLRREMERELAGKKIKSVEVSTKNVIKRHKTKAQFTDRLAGRKIAKIERRGAYLVWHLDSPDVLVAELGPAGRIARGKSVRDTGADSALVTLQLTQGGYVRMWDTNGAAQMSVIAVEELLETLPELATLGLDPVESVVSWETFGRALLRRSVALRSLLMDSTFLVGVGPVYADEILWQAGLRHDRVASSLTDQEIRRLLRAVVETLQEAVKHRGTSLDGKSAFTDFHGEKGGYQSFLMAYGRDGEACQRCRSVIVKARAPLREGERAVPIRYAYSCPSCQI